MRSSTRTTDRSRGEGFSLGATVETITFGELESANSYEPEWGARLMWPWESHKAITPRGNQPEGNEERLQHILHWISPDGEEDDSARRAWAELVRRARVQRAKEDPF